MYREEGDSDDAHVEQELKRAVAHVLQRQK
jgi:hypothetical protein